MKGERGPVAFWLGFIFFLNLFARLNSFIPFLSLGSSARVLERILPDFLGDALLF